MNYASANNSPRQELGKGNQNEKLQLSTVAVLVEVAATYLYGTYLLNKYVREVELVLRLGIVDVDHGAEHRNGVCRDRAAHSSLLPNFSSAYVYHSSSPIVVLNAGR